MRIRQKRLLGSAVLSAIVNALLFVVSIAAGPDEGSSFVQACLRIAGLPAGLFVEAVDGRGHGGTQVLLLFVGSYAFYWLAIWGAWTMIARIWSQRAHDG